MSAPAREGIILESSQNDGIQHITLRNVTVQNFTKHGVSIVGGEDVRIEHCDFNENGANVVPGAGLHHNLHLSYINGCKITGSRSDGSLFGNGIDLTFCQNVEISNSETARNALSGIRCAESQQITLTDNLSEGNDQDGIFIEKQLNACKQIAINGNTVQNNRRYGINASTAVSPIIENNRSLHNGKE